MQKLVQRTKKAERQVRRRAEEAAEREYRRERWQRLKQTNNAFRDFKRNVVNARLTAKEQWKLGPIAPDRTSSPNSGVARADFRGSSGIQSWRWPEHDIQQRCAWAGGPQNLNLRVGDRVVIMEGREKGAIDVVQGIHIDSATVTLKEHGQLVQRAPHWLGGKKFSNGQTFPEIALTPIAIPISAVRLVHPIPDPETGIDRDVIIRELRAVNFRHDRLTRTTEWDRYVPGLNVIIPWPDTPDPEEKVHPVDTPRQDLQEQTFVPTLLSPPMPADMINQLRNQYSRFRTRHEDWYLAQKEAEEAEKKKLRQFAKEMRTPQQELGAKIKAEKKARGEPELTDEMLGKIGEIMARNQGLDLKGIEAKLESLSR